MHTVGVSSLRDTIEDSIGPSLGAYLREQRRSAQLSLRQLAERAEVSNPYLSQVERGLRHPSAQVLAQIARGLQISATALYVRAGLLDEPAAGPADPEPEVLDPAVTGPADAVPVAVHADPYLHPRHKRLLLEVYETLRREAAADDAARAATAAPTTRPTAPPLNTAPSPGRTA